MVLGKRWLRVKCLDGYGVYHMCGEKACSALMVVGVEGGGEEGELWVDELCPVCNDEHQGCPITISLCDVVWVILARTVGRVDGGGVLGLEVTICGPLGDLVRSVLVRIWL